MQNFNGGYNEHGLKTLHVIDLKKLLNTYLRA